LLDLVFAFLNLEGDFISDDEVRFFAASDGDDASSLDGDGTEDDARGPNTTSASSRLNGLESVSKSPSPLTLIKRIE
jgi:hypothetical protein